MSTAMIRPAPAMRAPWMTLRPTPPQPMTATVSPGEMSAVFMAAPTPVRTPQPMRAADCSGTSSGILTVLMAGTMASLAKVPQNAIWPSSVPSEVVNRFEPSSRPPRVTAAFFSHM